MKITLVQLPMMRYDVDNLAPPLGLLTIAAVLEQAGHQVSICDFNLVGVRDHDFVDDDFYAAALHRIAATSPDLVGFTSMGIESHVALELARRLKRVDGRLRVMLGGSHFAAIARDALQRFPWIDYVVLGEGELACAALVAKLHTGRGNLADIDNLAWREGDRVHLQRRPKPMASLDDLPFPAYDLIDPQAYFDTNPKRVLHFEHGRGCALRCAFCYSPGHWGQGFQSKAVDRVIENIAKHTALGARHLFFVGDNLLNNRRWALQLADALADARLGVSWNAYATSAQLDDSMISGLGRAGCTGLFIGVDAVSDSLKKSFGKHYYRGWSQLESLIDRCRDHGIRPTLSIMAGGLDGDRADAQKAYDTAIAATNRGAGIRFNTLSIYNGTQLEQRIDPATIVPCDIKPRLLFDSFALNHANPFVQQAPHLFPFHSAYGRKESFELYARRAFVAVSLLHNFRKTLLEYASQGGDCWDLVEATEKKCIGLVDLPAHDRRRHVREAFVDTADKRADLVQNVTTYTLDRTGFRLSQREPDTLVSLDVDGATQPYRLTNFELDSATEPDEATRALSPSETQESSHGGSSLRLIYRQNGMTRSLAVPVHGYALISRMLTAIHRDGTNFTAREVAGLCKIGLLSPIDNLVQRGGTHNVQEPLQQQTGTR